MNIWVHDGSKDVPVQRKKYRELLAASLDEIMEEKLDGVKNCFEAKLFGIGLESYTVGSHDFYTAYCATRKQMYTLDTGHYEPTENVSDFVSTLLMYVPVLSGVNPKVHQTLKKSGFYNIIGRDNICDNIQEALNVAKKYVEK